MNTRNMMFKKFYLVFLFVFFSQTSLAALPDFTEMVEDNGDAVVNISTSQKAKKIDNVSPKGALPKGVPPEMEEFFRHFFNDPNRGFQPRESKSLGSGFIISSDGYVLTNHHVVNGADEIIVKLKDRRQLIAELVGSDERTDIAVLKVKATNLPVVKIGKPKRLKVGEWVLAIGSPFGFDQSVTAGIVSAKGRSLPGGNYIPFIQTDVAINPGNSGGPLFNMDGEVVGVNSQIYSRSGGYMGLSFAIPMDVVMNVVDQLKNKGSVSRGWLGVQIQDVTRELAESFSMDRPQGALVSKVISDSPAEKSGLLIGDVIIEFNGEEIDTSGDLPPIVGMTQIGKKAKVKVIRAGQKKSMTVKIGLLPETEMMASSGKEQSKAFNRLGIIASDLTVEQRKKLEIKENGVIVKSIKPGPALDVGIKQGDVILRIQNNVVRNVAGFDKIISNLSAGQSVAVLIQRQGSPIFLALRVE